MTSKNRHLVILAILIPATLIFHYLNTFWGGSHAQPSVMHHVLTDPCYIPIVLAAIWFGLRGAIITATIIGGFSFLNTALMPHGTTLELMSDYVEIIFFYLAGGISGMVLDKDRRLRSMLDETRRRLNQAERLAIVGQMVASVVHEIKSPLIAIRGSAQILRDKSVSDTQKLEYTTIIEKESQRLDGLVHSLLTYPRPSSSVLANIDIREPLLAVQKQLGFQSEIHGVQIVLKSAEVPIIRGDRDKLYQVFSNIIINAMQAMPSGGKVELNCFHVNDNSKEFVKIEIGDNGPGIKKDILPKIFQPFYTTKNDGTGLGLAIADTIIKEHGGYIDVQSDEGRGTKFIISLPVTKE